jgi:hypothetical protein
MNINRPGAEPAPFGSYPAEDVTFLLKDLSSVALERPLEDREEQIQSGRHYSEMLPIEYEPSGRYLELFHQTLEGSARRVARAVAATGEGIRRERGEDFVLVSLARAGTPIGVLLRRYLATRAHLDIPHYSISIIRGRGIDTEAVRWVLDRHPHSHLQIVDGWTGKGAIQRELTAAVGHGQFGSRLDDRMAVVADPGRCAAIWGTRDDFLLPSACLNATVSGLVSRTVFNAECIGPGDFHGAKFYHELLGQDVSNLLIARIASEFESLGAGTTPLTDAGAAAGPGEETGHEIGDGMREVLRIGERYGVHDINLIKPGVGETTRVLLRRLPWRVLVHPDVTEDLAPVLTLAEERGVPVEPYRDMAYASCGIIKRIVP